MRYVQIAPSLTCKGVEIDLPVLGPDGRPELGDNGQPKTTRKPFELRHVSYLVDVVLDDPFWRAGTNADANARLSIKLAILDKLEPLLDLEDGSDVGAFVELTDEEHEKLSECARQVKWEAPPALAAFKRKIDRFTYAVTSASREKPKASAPEAAPEPAPAPAN